MAGYGGKAHKEGDGEGGGVEKERNERRERQGDERKS
jgi:hypothetical protein